MFVSSGQFYFFIFCVAFGGISGVVLTIPSLLKLLIKNKIFGIFIDVFFWCLIALFYGYYSFKLNFPNFRFYMFAGVIIGQIIYFKSFYYILAKFIKKLYNIFKRKGKRAKTKCRSQNLES